MVGSRVRKKIHSRPKLIRKDSNPTVGSSSSAPPPWIELPTDVTANILQRLGAIEILESAQKVCTTWRTVCKDPAMWRVIDMRNSGDDLEIVNLDILCRRAVDRSLGELIDINIEYFGTDDLLLYISDRSSRLKRLRLACCDRISGKGLTKAVTKFPELEELHRFYRPWIVAGDIETISIHCPLLKSFSLNNRGYRYRAVDDSCALAIAKNMPNLRHIGLFGSGLSDEGVKAILDGCPHLESLDLRRCFMVELLGGLEERCFEQIKDVRCPFDSIADYEWDGEVSDTDVYACFGGFDDYGDDSTVDYDDVILDVDMTGWYFDPDN
ncbi:F-box protein skip19 [Phtheirospermum japonicum]|uniref:F-box protein skip19 n=1 Tax=Phtheirospermum japonicum TaxID=374723 RepID=A0A830B342_9LAMI|nr:F-box protein skip19 [Phtheirospermum japonicum]